MTTEKQFLQRISRAKTLADLDSLAAELERLHEEGMICGFEHMHLDHALVCERLAIETEEQE
jgi:hypothetical protein